MVQWGRECIFLWAVIIIECLCTVMVLYMKQAGSRVQFWSFQSTHQSQTTECKLKYLICVPTVFHRYPLLPWKQNKCVAPKWGVFSLHMCNSGTWTCAHNMVSDWFIWLFFYTCGYGGFGFYGDLNGAMTFYAKYVAVVVLVQLITDDTVGLA